MLQLGCCGNNRRCRACGQTTPGHRQQQDSRLGPRIACLNPPSIVLVDSLPPHSLPHSRCADASSPSPPPLPPLTLRSSKLTPNMSCSLMGSTSGPRVVTFTLRASPATAISSLDSRTPTVPASSSHCAATGFRVHKSGFRPVWTAAHPRCPHHPRLPPAAYSPSFPGPPLMMQL